MAASLRMSIGTAAARSLHVLPPEAAHRAAIWGLGHGLVPATELPDRPRLRTSLCGLDLAHPLGLAAGFDKNAEAVAGLFGLGFSYVEIGTVTPKPQAGNPRPRLFRLRAQQALINRMGFNNAGLEAVRARLDALTVRPGPLGANLGANRDSADPVADYVAGMRGLYDRVDYLTINVSSPNTPGLRDLQRRDRLRALLETLLAARAGLPGRARPLLLKVAPDLAAADEAGIAEVALELGIDGLIVSNTTIARPPTLPPRYHDEAGGLSGPPLFAPATEQLRRFRRLVGTRLALVGVGGIGRGADAYAKIRAGATALQLYTALVWQGPAVVPRLLAELDALLARDGYARLADAVGADVAAVS